MCGGSREAHDIVVYEHEQRQETRYQFMYRVAVWHGALQAQFERETFGEVAA